jgi:hypothetical protein
VLLYTLIVEGGGKAYAINITIPTILWWGRFSTSPCYRREGDREGENQIRSQIHWFSSSPALMPAPERKGNRRDLTAGDVYYLIATSYSGMIIKGGSAASIRRRPGLLLLRIGDKLGSGDGDVIWSACEVGLVLILCNWMGSFAIGFPCGGSCGFDF